MTSVSTRDALHAGCARHTTRLEKRSLFLFVVMPARGPVVLTEDEAEMLLDMLGAPAPGEDPVQRNVREKLAAFLKVFCYLKKKRKKEDIFLLIDDIVE